MRQISLRKFTKKKKDGFLNGKITSFLHFLTPQPPEGYKYLGTFNQKEMFTDGDGAYFFAWATYKPGEIGYMRENFATTLDDKGETCYLYKADENAPRGTKWLPASHMPIEAARIFLEITHTEIIRFDDLTADAAKATGAAGRSAVQQAKDIWDGELSRDQKHMRSGGNPWIQVVHFRTIPRPEEIVFAYTNDKISSYGCRIYTVRLADTEEIVAHGTARDCSQALGYSTTGGFYGLIKRIQSGNTKYTIEIKEPR